MVAKNKPDLISAATSEFEKLQKAIAGLPECLRLEPDQDGVSPKDIIGHRAHWIELFLGWYAEGRAGNTPSIPAEGYKWNELKQYNADLRIRQSDLSWSEALRYLKEKHTDLMTLVESLSEDDLYGAPMKGGNSKWTTGRWAEAAGPSHYRSASKYLRKRVKDAESAGGT